MKNRSFYPIICCLVIIPLLLSGCSSRFAYRNMDWLVHWYLDDYVDLDRQQKKAFDSKMKDWMTWHKAQELQAYKEHLQQLMTDIEQNHIDENRWAWHFDTARQHWQRARDHVSDDVIELAIQLNPEQVKGIFAELEDENRKREEKRNKRNKEERAQNTLEDFEEEVEEYAGSVTEEQKQIIAEAAPGFQSNFEQWMAYRRAWQQEAQRVMLSDADVDLKKSQLLTLFTQPENLQSQAFKDIMEHNRRLQSSLFAQLTATLTPEQRAEVLDNLQDLLEDISALQD